MVVLSKLYTTLPLSLQVGCNQGNHSVVNQFVFAVCMHVLSHRPSMSLSNEEEKPVTVVVATKYCVIAVMYKVITVYLLVHFYTT